MPKTDLPAQHISQTLLLYYNPSKDLRKIKVETVLEEMRQGKGQIFCIIRSLYLTITIRININKIPFLPLWKTHSSYKKKKLARFFRKGAKDKSSLLEFGRKHFFAVGDSWLYHIPAQLCCLHPVLDKLLAPLSPQVGRFLDSEAESRCLMNWGDLADVWPFPGPL